MKEEFNSQPFPHYLRSSQKEIHGWWHSFSPYRQRECTSERLLLNPYNGCTHNCPFCYARAYWREPEKLVVFKDFDRLVEKQLAKLTVASCGYLSPVSDPFQPIEEVYHLSEKLIKLFVGLNLPIDIVTKAKIPDKIITLLQSQKDCFAQVSILTIREVLRKLLVPGGATSLELFDNLARLKQAGIYAVCRIDPIIPFITDDLSELKKLISEAKAAGANHIIASCLDLPLRLKNEIINSLAEIYPPVKKEYPRLYRERIGSYLHARKEYRFRLFSSLLSFAKELAIGFSLCMEFVCRNKTAGGKPMLEGLNRYYMTSKSCEGKEIPLYTRKGAGEGEKFYPLPDCSGNCLGCKKISCKTPELAGASAWKLKDYVRWSKFFAG